MVHLVVLVAIDRFVPLTVMDDASSPFFFSKSDLSEGMFGDLGANGEEGALELGAELVGDERNGADLSVREGYRPGSLLVGGTIGSGGAGLGAQGSVGGLEGERVGAGLGFAAGLGHDGDVLDAVAELILASEALRGGGSHGEKGEEDNRFHVDG